MPPRNDASLPPGSTIGILGGGQLGRMLALAARRLGYRVVIVDPDPACPAATVADRQIVAVYDDVAAARGLIDACGVVTYELEHIDAAVVQALDASVPVRPGIAALLATQDRLAERAAVEELGISVAPWRAVTTGDDALAAADELGYPVRVKRARGGYDGRSQGRAEDREALTETFAALGDGTPLLLERELAFDRELSVVAARGLDGGTLTFPVAANRHDAGILIESEAPAPVDAATAAAAGALTEAIADGLNVVGIITAELFLMPDRTLVVNELAPRVHNSGHYTMDACLTDQFEQHVRAICGLPLGDPGFRTPGSAAAMVNLLGTGTRRPAMPRGVDEMLSDPRVRLHLYDKVEVFERRKMGHVTVVAATADEALRRARRAAGRLSWAT